MTKNQKLMNKKIITREDFKTTIQRQPEKKKT